MPLHAPRDSAQLSLWSDPASSQAAPPPSRLPATFRHPRGNREARLDGHVVGYEFRRMRRKTIGFAIAAEGLVVSAPRWVPWGEIDAALQEKARWILKKLQEQDERTRRIAAQRIDWRDGASIPFLGESVIVVLDPRVTGSQLHEGPQLAALAPPEGVPRDLGRPGAALVGPQLAALAPPEGVPRDLGRPGAAHTADGTLPGVPRRTLHVGLPQHAAPEQIRDTVQAWLQRQARRVFEERCGHFAPRLGVQVTRLSLSSATTRWGSAGADGAIRLHWRLIHFALPTIDYVVAHELAHLRVMDHSPRFWDVVRSVIPDVERVRGALRDEALPAFD